MIFSKNDDRKANDNDDAYAYAYALSKPFKNNDINDQHYS